MILVRTFAVVLALAAGNGAADVWTEPVPLRSETLLEGRDFTYGTLAFLHRLSYRHLSQHPSTDADGVRGTAGSVSSDRLFVDIHLQKSLPFDDGRHGMFLRLQRFETLDGPFDRQIVGLQRRLGSDWTFAAAGDVRGDKADTDVQFEARWQPDEQRLMRLTYIRPEAFFNDKGDGEAQYAREPNTWFAHYRQSTVDGVEFETAASVSPRAEIDVPDQALTASGRQARAMVRALVPLNRLGQGNLDLGVRLEYDGADRDFDWTQPPAAAADSFRRRMHAAEIFITVPDLTLPPTVGYRWLRLREDGWFGNSLATTGRIRRDEHVIYGAVRIDTGERHHLEPAVYLSHIDQDRTFDLRPGDDRQRSLWAGKLALPWRYTVHEPSGAMLTINLTARLHTASFGGGNVQLHWPL